MHIILPDGNIFFLKTRNECKTKIMNPGYILSKIQLWAEKAFSESDKLVLKHILFSETPISPYDLKEIFHKEYNKSYNILHRSFNKIDDYKMVNVTTVPSDKGGQKNVYQFNYFGFSLSMTILYFDLERIDLNNFLSLLKIHSDKDILLKVLMHDFNLENYEKMVKKLIAIKISKFLENSSYYIGVNDNFSVENIDAVFCNGWIPSKNFNPANDYSHCYMDFFFDIFNVVAINSLELDEFLSNFVYTFSNHDYLKNYYFQALENQASRLNLLISNVLRFSPESEIESIKDKMFAGGKASMGKPCWLFK